MTNEVLIREARPEDAVRAAPLIYSSGPACFDYIFSHRTPVNAIQFLERMFAEPKGEFGFTHHRVAELFRDGDGESEGEVVGTGTFFTGAEVPGFTIAALRQILGCYGLSRGPGVIRRGLQIEGIVRPPKGDMHVIAHIGVAPELRGRGIGTIIMEHLMQAGRERGRSVAVLDVSAENPRAQALYERLGFVVTDERPSNLSNETATVPDHRRMEARLG